MQTFLPYPDFTKSAQCLDNKRLGCQRKEAWQIYLALTKPNYGWKNHPIVRMWKGYEDALLMYGYNICLRWKALGYRDILQNKFKKELVKRNCLLSKNWMNKPPIKLITFPHWLGNKKFHASHRSNLLRKDPKHYGKFGWKEPNNLPYVWLVKKGK